MGPEILAYPFLFIAIFFESFVLVTLLSKPARASRARLNGPETPSVAVIVPCWNEASTIAATVESALALDYPKNKLEVILVDDGSTDGTPAAMTRFEGHPQVRIIRKENGGKHTALNAGIALTRAELVGCLDADSFVAPDALREIVVRFTNPRVAAVTAAMSVHEPQNILQHMQHAEYSFGITLRHTFASVNGLYVTPGPFSFYRREIVEQLGGFSYGHQTEDMEMALRLQQYGYEIENAHRARVYTKAPATVKALIKQRVRWISGFLRNILGEYRGLIWSKRHGALGMLVLPSALIAIVSGIGLFGLMFFLSTKHAVTAISIRAGVPLSYSLIPHHATFDWFYFPGGFYTILAILLVAGSLTLIVVGKRISRSPGRLALSLPSYFLYGLIAPFWLMLASRDVASGKKRGWRH